MKKIFPHEGIPHSVLFDKNGKLIGSSHPSFIDGETIAAILSGSPVDLQGPMISAGNVVRGTDDSEEYKATSLFLFDLSRTNKNVFGMSLKTCSIGDGENTAMEYSFVRYNALSLLSFAHSLPENRIFLSEELAHFEEEFDTDHLYDLVFYCKFRWQNPMELLKSLLPPAFGVEARMQEREMDAWIIKGARETSSIQHVQANEGQHGASINTVQGRSFAMYASSVSLERVASEIEGQVNIPIVVEQENSGRSYKVDLDIQYQGGGSDKFFDLLLESGLIIEKGRRNVEVLVVEPK